MDETRRFLRYVVPALAFLTEVALLLLLTQKGCLIGSVSARLRTGGAGFAALILVMAGGLGYLFSLLHHTLFWYYGKYGVDYTDLVKTALAHGWLRLVTYRKRNEVTVEEPVESECVTCIVAWDVVTFLWYRPGRAGDEKDPELGEVFVHRTDTISDLMHGLGTSVIAACFILPTWAALYFWLCHEPLPPSLLVISWYVLLMVVLWVLFILLHLSNYIRVRNHLVRLVSNALATQLARIDPATQRPSDPATVSLVNCSVLEATPDTARSTMRRVGTALRNYRHWPLTRE
jgi:hypothetical protein